MTTNRRTVLFSLLLAVVLIVGCCTQAFAATTFTVRVLNGKLYILKGSASYGTYSLKSTAITLEETSDGTLSVSFLERNNSENSSVALGSKSDIYLTFSGTMDSLNLAESLSEEVSVTVSGNIGTVTVRGCPVVTVGSGAVLNRLTIKNDDARVTVKSSASVGTTTGLSSNSASLQPQTGSIDTYLKVTTSGNPTYSASLKYNDTTCTLTVTGNAPGVTLAQIARDITLGVYRVSNDARVSGSWKWLVTTSSETGSGSYIYQFTPSSSSYSGQNLYVKFTAYNDRNGSGNTAPSRPSTPSSPSTARYTPTISVSQIANSYISSCTFNRQTNTLTITPRYSGTSLKNIFNYLNLTVQYNGRDVAGSWAWTTGSASATAAGTYTYTFTPSSSVYRPINLTVVYKSGTQSSASYPLKVSAVLRSSPKYTSNFNFNSNNNTLALTASKNTGITLLQAISDVSLTASYNGTAVGGTWNFTTDAKTTTPGTYTYTFTPSSSRYQPVSVTVIFSIPATDRTNISNTPNGSGNGNSAARPGNGNQPGKPNNGKPNNGKPNNGNQSGKPNNGNNGNAWGNSKPGKGPEIRPIIVQQIAQSGTRRTVQLTIPSDVRTGDQIQILLNGRVIATYDLKSSNANQVNRYYITASGTVSAQIVYN